MSKVETRKRHRRRILLRISAKAIIQSDNYVKNLSGISSKFGILQRLLLPTNTTMKTFLTIIFAIAVLACTEKTTNTRVVTSNKDSLQTANDSLKKIIDSLRRPEAFTADTLARDAASPSGKNPITLQWISWAKPGEATLDALPDGSYQISGSQANDQREYLNIMGVI